ncbi:hypothetical protein SYNPS1DRAFT_31715 [Syncephalis pseudoplumigaleata]|uniref:Uncharacterized protein n=1 Tax=Syncephalis pseudoplumigaleata TaxID=1712513 RepID=A0A4P9YSL8_9FUNG|nr:hypothetical protein SYNPS1DRAFT_31715 [Syncephalis pseudoplumigaleata]|eukprot:RKP22668.1 hypothetical protein SYNPS1DRAFT_31715 [Syncephalis pseudoplumigaleata]
MSGQLEMPDAASATQLATAEILNHPASSQNDPMIFANNNNNSNNSGDSNHTGAASGGIQPQHLPLSPPDEQKLECTTLDASDVSWISSKSMPATPYASDAVTSASMFSSNVLALQQQNESASDASMSAADDAACEGMPSCVQRLLRLDPDVWEHGSIDSDIVCCYHDVVLRVDDLRLLSPGQWLNDTWIEFFYE